MMGSGWGMGYAGWIFLVLVGVVVVGLLLWAAVALRPGTRTRGRPPAAEEILDRRFALGELNAEQYGQARARLAETRAAGTGAAGRW